MNLDARIADSIAALDTCTSVADLRDVWANVYRHWNGGVPEKVGAHKDRLKQRLTPKRYKETA